ncbi:MAG TPA: beta-N-acetylhexosaminidase, partial [Thermoprotei archaeon]|nr:beta-N-acetylhexosaminidase [Thermoprotei archaeon]
DIARGGVPKVDTFKEILRLLFLLKYNFFAIYFEDLYPWKSYPSIGLKRGKLTLDEWNEILEYGGKLGIDVFPSLELAGHMENILTLPEFRKYSEWHRPREGCLDVSDEEARKFAYTLLKEALDTSPSKYIHIGGDETWAMGRGKSLDKTLTYKGPDLYLMHHKNMINMVKERNKKPILWGDMLTGMYLRRKEGELWSKLVEDRIWSEVIIANWDYSPSPKEYFVRKIRLFSDRGYVQIACPGYSNWNKYYPDFDTALKNISNFLGAAREEKIFGFMATAWGDDGEECLFSHLYPLILATMEIAEGNGRWEEKWITISGENEKILEFRKDVGKPEVSNYIKKVLFNPVQEIKDYPIYNIWRKILEKYRDTMLPEPLKFIYNCIKVGIEKVDGKVNVSDYIALSNQYTYLWLKERKHNGLERIVARFWSAASQLDLIKKL